LCLMFNDRPEHTQQRMEQVCHWYVSRVSVSDALGWQSGLCTNDHDWSAQAEALPQMCEPMSHLLSQELNNWVDYVYCWIGLEIMQRRSWPYVARTHRCTWALIICQQLLWDCHKLTSLFSNTETQTPYCVDSLLTTFDCQISGDGCVITRLKT
jgi:hypothetical protein